jgi:hypothetical protein
LRTYALCSHMLSLMHTVHARCNTVLLLAVFQQQHYRDDGSSTSGVRRVSKVALPEPAAVIAACIALLDPVLMRRQGGMQPSQSRLDSYRDDSYAGDGYTGGGHTAGFAVCSSRCVLL